MTKPTNDRARQRELLSELLISVPCKWNGAMDRDALADKLLDNGVSVELPPEPEVKAGTTGTATYQGDPGVRVVRVDSWATEPLNFKGGPYVWLAPNSMSSWGTEADVTDFVPDPEPLTPDIVDFIVDWFGLDDEEDGLTGAKLREQLAPHVAKA
jgi:hypothetical protein